MTSFARGPVIFILLAVMSILWIAFVLAALCVAIIFMWVIGLPATSAWLEPKVGTGRAEIL